MRHADPPARFELPDEWDKLEAALPGYKANQQLQAIRALCSSNQASLAFIERDYVDLDYRDEFANFYAGTYRAHSDRCERVHLFSGTHDRYRYMGYVVLRPIRTAAVGRTMLIPLEEDEPFVSCKAPITARAYGEQYGVEAFPFMQQDSQYGVCAHVSVWMVALYHHLVHHTPRVLMSDVWKGAQRRSSLWRALPSGGLSDEQLHSALVDVGLAPIIFNTAAMLRRGERPEEVACRYLNSKLPVILTYRSHVTVLVGYGRDRNGHLFFIQSDEDRGPYQRFYRDDDPLGQWSRLFVPLPGKIYMSGEVAEREGGRALEGLLRQRNRPLWTRLTRNGSKGLRLRSYVTNGGAYKVRMSERGVPSDIAAAHARVGTSHWIWVIELQDPEAAARGARCVLGEVAIDATSDDRDPNLLFGHLPGKTYIWNDDGTAAQEAEAEHYSPYISGTAVHDAPFATPLQRTRGARIRSLPGRARVRARQWGA